MLREDKTARIERTPGKWTGRFHKRTQLPDTYEFSVGKYTRSGNLARNYVFRVLESGGGHSELQQSQPVLLMHDAGIQWWWFWNRFWRDDENLDAADVQALVVQRERQKQAKLERARAGILGDTESSAGSQLAQDRLLKQEERGARRGAPPSRPADDARLAPRG